jgi:polysaccharide export outer membrane protein
MFQTEEDQISIDSIENALSTADYILRKGDKISFQVFSNEGFRLVDQGVNQIGLEKNSTVNNIEYIVDKNGKVRLPIINEVKLEGLSVKQAERFLEEAFEEIIQDPFVNVTVLSWRVFVFKGLGGAGQVVPIEFQNTTLVEILARAGGIPQDAKAYKIKVIRGVDEGEPQVFMVNYSTINHVNKTNLQILSNDIIYIEPVQRISNGLVTELSPYLSLLSVILLISNLLGNNAG